MSGVLTVALSLRAFNVYTQTSNRAREYVRISLVLPDYDCFEEIRTEKAGLSGEINYTLDAYSGTKNEEFQGWATYRGLQWVGVSRERLVLKSIYTE